MWQLVLILGLYLGGMIPLLANECLDERTGLPVSSLMQLQAALSWPFWMFKGRGE